MLFHFVPPSLFPSGEVVVAFVAAGTMGRGATDGGDAARLAGGGGIPPDDDEPAEEDKKDAKDAQSKKKD